MQMKELEKLFNEKVAKAIEEEELLEDGTCIESDGDYFQVDWCGLEPKDLWDELGVEDELDEEMDLDEIEDYFQDIISSFNNNLSIYDPRQLDDGGMGLGDLTGYEIVNEIPEDDDDGYSDDGFFI